MAETKEKNGAKEKMPDPNELVPYTPFYDGHEYKDDVVVGVNGRRWQLKRGETHMIPRYVYDVIVQNEQQKARSNEFKRAQQEAFQKSSRNI